MLKLSKSLFQNALIPAALCLFPCMLNAADMQQQKNDSRDSSQNEELLRQISRGFSTVAKKAIPAVVYIESEVTSSKPSSVFPQKKRRTPSENPFDYFNDDFFNRFFGFPDDESSKRKSETIRGSGFFVSSDGHILTNYHVVENATKVVVTLNDGQKLTATIIGSDPKTDLAVIKVDQKNHPYLTFGNSDTLEVGDWVIAVGNPFGLNATVTVGVVSAKGRNQLHITDFDDFIQTDAAINPGNSGGPLLNIQAEVIGINTAIVSGSGGYMGIGFAIPSNMAARITDQLIKSGSVTRGFLGVTLQPIDTELASYYKLDRTEGALITEVVKDSPAQQAGLKQEDIIVKYNNNTTLDNLSAFRNAVALMPAGSVLPLKVYRDGKIIDIKVTIGNSPEAEKEVNQQAMQKLGLEVQNLTPELAHQLNYTEQQGIVVKSVKPGSPAAEAGIRPGNLILAVNRKKVSNIEEYQRELQEASKEKRVLLIVRQGEVVRFVALPIE